MDVCRNCDSESIGRYCANCGQPFSMSKRVGSIELTKDIFHSTFNTGSGMTETLKLLVLHPEKVLHGYLNGKRRLYFSPVKLFLLVSVIYMTVNIFIDSHNHNTFMPIKGEELFNRFKYFFIFGSIVINAGLNWLVFRKRKYNYAEHLIVAMYLYSVINLSMSVFSISMYFLNTDFLYYAMIMMYIYYVYAMTKFYGGGNLAQRIVLNIFVYLLTAVLFLAPLVYYVVKLLREQQHFN